MSDLKKHKILIVDDERSNIIALAHILTPKYDVLAAKDGKTALELAKENRPDLILLDVVMSDMSGFEVLTKLKGSELTQGIPVIFITGRDNIEDEETGLFLGAVDYVTKPFHSSIVSARVRTHLQIVEYVRTIEKMCVIDALTNIPNRRSFDTHLNSEWERAIREETPISILMMDLDDFKGYNDTYGHPQGDALLQVVANIFMQSLKRPRDFVARWGGDEFAILLPETDQFGALEVAGNIHGNTGRAVILCADGTETRITVSIGVNSIIPSLSTSVSDFVAGADRSLYSAKKSKPGAGSSVNKT